MERGAIDRQRAGEIGPRDELGHEGGDGRHFKRRDDPERGGDCVEMPDADLTGLRQPADEHREEELAGQHGEEDAALVETVGQRAREHR